MQRSTGLLLAAALGLAAGGAVAVVLRRQRSGAQDSVFDAQPRHAAPVAPSGVVDSTTESARTGTPADRGRTTRIGLDVDRLKTKDEFEPVVQYLTFIQSQRGDGSHLLFIRYEDIDAMAALEGEATTNFLERLDQLGVVISNN